jgi:hypothetical protein
MTSENNTENKEEGMPAWVMPILSALGSMGGSYMLWVKPLQDSFKAMSDQIEELREEVRELKGKRKPEKFEGEDEEEDYILPSRKLRPVKTSSSKRNTLSLR